MKSQLLLIIKNLLTFWHSTFLNKSKRPSGRELTTFVFVIVVLIAWIAQQFYQKSIPEWMFISFITIISCGLGFYTIEKKN